MSHKEKPSIIWFSTREIAISAAFGGLLFASVALGLVIPILPGGASAFALQGLSTIASIAGGPIAGFIVSALGGTPRPFAVVNWFLALMEPVTAFAYYPMKDKPLKVRLPYVVLIRTALYLSYFALVGTWFLVHVYHLFPPEGFWELFWLMETVFTPPSIVLEIVFIGIAFILFPEFMKPDWWDRWKKGRATVKAWEETHAKESSG